MTQPINILHLTDFHYTRREDHDQRVVTDALIKDIRRLSDGPLKPDVVVFSGDLVDRADEDRTYDYFYDNLLEPVTKAAKCTESRVILTPGNHDTHRKFVERERHRHDGMLRNLRSRETLNAEYKSGLLDDFVAAKFKGFHELRGFLGGSIVFKNALASVYRFDDLRFCAVEVNSAWMGYAGLDGIRDERKLMIPEAALYDAMRHVPDGFGAALVTHHPVNWLTEFCESDLLNSVDGRFSLALFGHMHEARPQHVTSFKGRCLFNQGGALYSTRRSYIGYSLTRLEPADGHLEVQLRSYFDGRREFDRAIDLHEGGVFHPSEPARSFYYRLGRAVDRSAVRAWCAESVLPAAEKEFNEGLTERKLSDLFVAPPLYARANLEDPEKADSGEAAEVSVAFEQVVSSSANYFILGNPEYGKTTLIRQVALQRLRRLTKDGELSVPVVINFGAIRKGEDRLQSLIRAALPELPEKCTIHALLSEGLVTLLCDDVNRADPVRYPVLRDFVKRFPKVRYLFTAPTSRNDRLLAKSDGEMPVSFETLSIRPLRRKEMRTLVEKWDCDQRLNKDEVLDRLLREIRSMNVPFTAVNGTILLTVLEDQSDFTPINRAVLIEHFVEVMLEKRVPEDSERRRFDFRNRTHYLAHVAGQMARMNRYVLDSASLFEITTAYLNTLGLAQKADDLISLCLSARIFVKRPDGDICFRYRAFLEFFLAKQMKESSEFREWVLSDERYLSYVNEIQYYAGIGRNDDELVHLLGERYAALEDQAFASGKPDLSLVDSFALGKFGSSDELLDAVSSQLAAPPLTPAERDELLDAELPQDVEGRQEVFRPDPKDAGSRYFTSLVLYSNVLRNSELVADSAKRQHLAKVLRGWGFMLTGCLAALPLLVKQRRLRVNGVEYVVAVPRHMSDQEVARLVFFEFPNVMSKLVYATVGTEKLERQLVEPDLSEADEPKVVKFLRQGLCMDLRLGDWPARFRSFLETLRSNRYLLESALWKANEAFVLGSMSDKTRIALARSMAEVIATLRGLPRSEREKSVNERMVRYRRQDLVRKLHANFEE